VPEPSPPTIVLGVRRSGTTLLRVMLDRNAALAIPDESYFVPQLATRHRGTVDVDEFLDDLRRLPTLAEWGLAADAVGARLRPGMTTGEAIAAVFEAYAAEHGKPRWGDKTPLYMQHLRLLERLFPTARLRAADPRRARRGALVPLGSPGIMTEGWGHPRDARGIRVPVGDRGQEARALGARVGPGRYLEVRYEALVAGPEAELRRVCELAGLDYEETMLGYVGHTESARKDHQQRLNEPPRVGVRDWRTEMAPSRRRGVRACRRRSPGRPGIRRHDPRSRRTAARRLPREDLGVAIRRHLTQRSPLWRRRHAVLRSPVSDTFGLVHEHAS
jgi:hypothetical protein